MSALVAADGVTPLLPVPAQPALPKKRAALSGDAAWAFPYDAASWYQPETSNWFPVTYSPDHEINVYRDRMVGRVRDLTRNDGVATGAILTTLDQVIGGTYRLIALPNWRWLQRNFGAGFDAQWAKDYRAAIETEWQEWSEDPLHYNDAERQLSVADQMWLALRHQLLDGDSIGCNEWHPERVGYGMARYATTVRLIDPDRLSNPFDMIDTHNRRGGVEIDNDGVPLGYHFRRAHQFDWYDAVDSNTWDYVPRETEWGRPIVLHYYDRDRTTQHRGLAVFTPVLNTFKMLNRFDAVTLQAAVLQAVYSLAIESPFDPAGLREALADGQADDGLKFTEGYLAGAGAFHKQVPVRLNNAAIHHLYPGETIRALGPTQPGPEYDPLLMSGVQRVAGALGTTVEEITRNWTRGNYSSARAGFVSSWRTIMRRRARFDRGFAKSIYVAWHEEAFEVAKLPLPSGAPDFPEIRGAITRCKWIGAPRGWVDPVKEAQGAVLRMDAGISTLQQEAAEQGHDWEELLEERAYELERMRALNIPPPTWIAGISMQGGGDEPAHEAAKRPQPA